MIPQVTEDISQLHSATVSMAKLWSSQEWSWNSHCHQLHYLLYSGHQFIVVVIVFSPMIITKEWLVFPPMEGWVGLGSSQCSCVCKVDNDKEDFTNLRIQSADFDKFERSNPVSSTVWNITHILWDKVLKSLWDYNDQCLKCVLPYFILSVKIMIMTMIMKIVMMMSMMH